MKVVLQRSKQSKVTIDGKINGKIDHNYIALVSFTNGDSIEIIDKMIKKIINLRVFTDENDKMNLALADVNGSVLVISNFTLCADCKKGKRPSFFGAAAPELADALYERFLDDCRARGFEPRHGEFGADMQVESCNDGPVTIPLDTDDWM